MFNKRNETFINFEEGMVETETKGQQDHEDRQGQKVEEQK